MYTWSQNTLELASVLLPEHLTDSEVDETKADADGVFPVSRWLLYPLPCLNAKGSRRVLRFLGVLRMQVCFTRSHRSCFVYMATGDAIIKVLFEYKAEKSTVQRESGKSKVNKKERSRVLIEKGMLPQLFISFSF